MPLISLSLHHIRVPPKTSGFGLVYFEGSRTQCIGSPLQSNVSGLARHCFGAPSAPYRILIWSAVNPSASQCILDRPLQGGLLTLMIDFDPSALTLTGVLSATSIVVGPLTSRNQHAVYRANIILPRALKQPNPLLGCNTHQLF